MKLEYLIDGSPKRPRIRLYDFTPAEAGGLRGAVSELASEAVQRIEVHGLPFVEPVGGCELALVRNSWDQGVLRAGTSKFMWWIFESRNCGLFLRCELVITRMPV